MMTLGLCASFGAKKLKPAAATSPATSSKLREDYDTFAAKYDVLDGGPFSKYLGLEKGREELIGKALAVGGPRILEVGVGTGLNLPYYKGLQEQRLDAIDLSLGMLQEAKGKAQALGIQKQVQFHEMNVERLNFNDATFDVVLDTFSLCVFPDPVAALKEMARVCKPEEGRVLLLENSRSDNVLVGGYQDLTAQTIAHKFGGKGCVWNQDVKALVGKAGLIIVEAKPIAGGLFTLLECMPLLSCGR